MDPDNNCDSDTSEGWSVIDINENDHTSHVDICDGFGSHIVPINYEWNTGDMNSDENGEVDLHSQQPSDAIQNLNVSNSSVISQNAASLLKQHCKGYQDFQVLYKGKGFLNESNLEEKSSEYNCNKSNLDEAEKIEHKLKDVDNDTDCISIISESEWNDLKVSAYETDEIWEEKLSQSNIQEKTHPNILKRKRKRLKLNCRESSEESITSDFMVPDGKYYFNIQNIDYNKSDNEMQVTEYENAPVYRHYRNNVANTVLTLAMGVIFTGVACIAVGHFLGVHDAQHTAGEMMETLKRLQMENVLLHTRLTQLSRAFFSRGNSKLQIRGNVEPQNCLDRYLQENIRDRYENNVNNGSPIKNSIFFRGGSFDISTNVKEPANKLTYQDSQNLEKIKVIDQNHDHSNFFNISKYEEKYSKPPYSSTAPVKAGENYKFSSGKNLQKVKENIPRGDRRVRKRSADDKCCIGVNEQYEIGRDKDDCLAVREKDLSQSGWFVLHKKKKRRSLRLDEGKLSNQDGDGVYVYKFPQREEYYKDESFIKNKKLIYNKLKLEELCNELKLVRYPKVKDPSMAYNSTKTGEGKGDESKEMKHYLRAKKEKKTGRDKKDKVKDLDDGISSDWRKKRENFQKKNQTKKINSKGSKKCKIDSSQKNGKMKECRKKGDREFYFKLHSKKSKDEMKEKGGEDARKYRRNKEKYLKGGKMKKVKFRNESRPRLHKSGEHLREKKAFSFREGVKFTNQTQYADFGSNTTAAWLFKWAKGREKCRRDKKIGDWLFDRAKSRAASRIGDAYWQFNRAFARESRRNDAYVHFRKKNKYFQHKGFSSDAYSWI